MATREATEAVRTEFCAQHDYHSDALVEALCAALADARNERDALQAALDGAP